ncbi:LPS export ABC transporter ATP-binding protein [Pleionea litopenaei]|uniref:Lipopolysaccharide export system ATP-binding protein LptB n=1 Tax=Pleionea litopenaei TaxID=3070815 RepID=A0AA51X6R6_9GAMM|nr:LPS export ABC transporter ATP-binding protein [Pleionea sp. HL-JVS1]WMS87116.1 LPS export ABC transporter ATP-binding protein [Pleionea sp. HL-JVS1]
MSELTAANLAKAYKGRQVVKDVSLKVGKGQIVGLLGPNGAGKTTSFYMIVGLVPQDSGKITLNGQDISQTAMHERAKLGLGYLPQEPSVFRKLSVADNIMSVLELRTELTQEQRQQEMEKLLGEFQIEHIKSSLGMSLSGGERRRVEIARALANNPQYILLDEPFAGVDPISINEIKHIIEQLKQRGLGVLITDHHVRETLSVCERAYIVSAGELIAAGTSEQVLNDPTVKKVYLGDEFNL